MEQNQKTRDDFEAAFAGGDAETPLPGRDTRYGNTVKKAAAARTGPLASPGRHTPPQETLPKTATIETDPKGPERTAKDKTPPAREDAQLFFSPNGRYARLNRLLGKGAYKTVWHAIDKEEGVEVAWNSMQSTKSEYNDLQNEIEILKKVRHKNIIHLHDSWFDGNEFVFVTEMMTSGTLREYIKRIGLPTQKVVRKWLRQILEGINYLHEHTPTIIHRDLKCDNIFINGTTGEIKIGDMGTAKMKFGKKYTVIGTPEFMAPEMYEESGYNEKVDIYAFGMCILEILTGDYPYSECQNPAQVYKKVSSGLKPDSLAGITDPELLSLINFCITTEKERLSARQLLQHQFFFEEVSLSVLDISEDRKTLTFKMLFKGQGKNTVRFHFNTDTDTPEHVVEEMITENLVSSRFRAYVIKEIVRLLGISTQESETKETAQGNETGEGPRDTDGEPGSTAKKAYMDFAPVGHEYTNDRKIEELVMEAALQTNRTVEKANEWIEALKKQEIMTVGDLRGLHEEDWKHLNLSVFAMRAIKNAMEPR
ncbi:MAG: WNK protein kinase [Amphiamblys sp. WSBS2006]|nr:MAG: WNK protein kinase [Amphiamblys sp. WSBS2006]